MHPLLRKAKAATLRLSKQARAGLQRLVAGPRSLERLLLFSIAGTVLFAILAIALASFGLLRDQAQDQALARVRAAAHAARYEIRRVGEDTVTAARLLASRPTLARLVQENNLLQLQLFQLAINSAVSRRGTGIHYQYFFMGKGCKRYAVAICARNSKRIKRYQVSYQP